jgi:hypothetical protein
MVSQTPFQAARFTRGQTGDAQPGKRAAPVRLFSRTRKGLNLLESIRVRRFKSIVDAEITLGRVTVLVGPNNAGKSSFLKRSSSPYQQARASNSMELVDGLRPAPVAPYPPNNSFTRRSGMFTSLLSEVNFARRRLLRLKCI